MRLFFIFIFTFLFLYGVDATIKIEKDVDQRESIEILDSSSSALGKKAFEIFVSDFKISSHFLPSKEYKQESFSNFTKYRAKKYILKYKISQSLNKTTLLVKLIKSSNLKTVLQKTYSISYNPKYPFLIHKAVSDINDKLGFKSINWINRYLLYSEYTGKKRSIIGVADYTFNYKKVIIRGGLNIFPIWGDKNQNTIYYTSFDTKIPTLNRLNLKTGEIKKILSSQGMLICSDVSKDGKRLLLTMAPSSQPDIYLYNLASNSLKQLTTFRGIDVGAKFANQEKEIVFVSNRLGYANIFKKSINSDSAVEAIAFGKNNDSCDVFDKEVVYSSKDGAKSFNLYLTTIDATTPRPLTSTGINQFPKFSPDGEAILYIKRTPKGNFLGYISLKANISMLFPVSLNKIQSIDW